MTTKLNAKALSAIALAATSVAVYSCLIVPLMGMLETARVAL